VTSEGERRARKLYVQIKRRETHQKIPDLIWETKKMDVKKNKGRKKT